MRFALSLFFLLLALLPGAAFSAPGDFIEIVPIPDIPYDEGLTFAEYVNQFFRLSVIIGAILAVIMLVYGGFEYMTGVKAGDKKSGLDRVRGAIIGLVLLLSVYLLLYVINPCILRITAFTDAKAEDGCVFEVQSRGDPAGGGSENETPQNPQDPENGAESGSIGQAVPEGACFDDETFACGDSPAVAVCRSGNGATYAPQSGGTCASGNPQFMCAPDTNEEQMSCWSLLVRAAQTPLDLTLPPATLFLEHHISLGSCGSQGGVNRTYCCTNWTRTSCTPSITYPEGGCNLGQTPVAVCTLY